MTKQGFESTDVQPVMLSEIWKKKNRGSGWLHAYAGSYPDTPQYEPSGARPMVPVRNRLGCAAVTNEPLGSFLAHGTWPFRPAGGSIHCSHLGIQVGRSSMLTGISTIAGLEKEDTGSQTMHFCLEMNGCHFCSNFSGQGSPIALPEFIRVWKRKQE